MDELLLALVVLTHCDSCKGHLRPVPNANVSCADVVVYDEDSPEGVAGGILLPTDSAGRMFFQGPAGDYHCRCYKEGYAIWSGVLTYDKQHTSRTMELIPAVSD